ncbi:acid-shock protein [Yersinia ruckeri]|uniref:Acid shock protein n=1 Tax=Yersinia ruckeri TaxID=29486 RepID=A0A085U7P2_YERRU|nr:acid resistance repetitive basic protein Asr [Yersinia ruckeri]AKA37278.1 acid-shock protein [Yersinia ruckeri]ARZ00988.1 acid shock protein [Yersinia ruckeri]EEQ00474.1 Acid shock protein [Yersinia ruckeri ATCC 29473]EKN4181321.1 acid resistance repetitive basic protein Asr [Yersinia ruckeri]EKN4686794.1 acid resistance repetitive basic protein Asr [Yersinia ruckeri]
MKKVLAFVVAATLGLSSAAFAADTAVAPTTTTVQHSTTAKMTHEKQAKKAVSKTEKNPAQKAQAAKKHHKASVKAAPAAK